MIGLAERQQARRGDVAQHRGKAARYANDLDPHDGIGIEAALDESVLDLLRALVRGEVQRLHLAEQRQYDFPIVADPRAACRLTDHPDLDDIADAKRKTLIDDD